MKTYRVVFTRPARKEALDAARYIARHAPLTAAQWYEGLADVIQGLATLPHRFGKARESEVFPSLDLRQVVYKSHRIIYDIDKKTVRVLHVRHGAMGTLWPAPGESEK